MIQSSKPRKQRKFRYTAPMHARQKLVHARIAKELAARLAIKKRNTEIRKGDTVKVMSGGSKGKSGKVASVSLRKGVILIEGIVRKNAKGKELPIPIRPSNVYITDLDLSDKLRSAKFNVTRQPAKEKEQAAQAKV